MRSLYMIRQAAAAEPHQTGPAHAWQDCCKDTVLDLVPACLQEHSCDSSPAGGNRASEVEGWLAEDPE